MPKHQSLGRQVLLWACLAIFSVNHPAQALWLNAYGTSADEMAAKQIVRLDGGGYLATGEIILDNQPTNWYGRLDEQGGLLWSKTSGEVKVSVDDKGLAHLQTKLVADNTSIMVNATGSLDLATGAISNIRIANNLIITGNNGSLQASGLDGIFVGTWQTPDNNRDAVITKVNGDNQILWSHRYDFSANDPVPALFSLKGGYLLVLAEYRYNPATYSADWVNVLAKLDADGNLVPGKAVQLVSRFGLFPTIMSDGSVVLSSHSFSGDFIAYKLDNKLNYVWGKRFYSPEGKDVFINASVAEGLDGQLEFYPYRQQWDAEGQLLAEHALAIVMNTGDGSLLTKTEVRIGQVDAYPFSKLDATKFRLLGETAAQASELQPDPGQDGVFALFNNSFQPEWVKTLAGQDHDQIEIFNKASGAKNYVLGGNTQSWGSGKADMLFAKLDQKGSIAGCDAIKDVNPVMAEPDIAVQDLPSPITTAGLTDAGSPALTVTSQQYGLEFKASDYPMTVTKLCAADDPVELVSVIPPPTPPTPVEPVTPVSSVDTSTATTETKTDTVTPATTTDTVTAPTTTDMVSTEPSSTGTTLTPADLPEPPVTTVVSGETVNKEVIAPEITKPELIGSIKLSSAQLDFGNVVLQKSALQIATINNTGDGLLRIAEISAPANAFSILDDSCSNTTIGVGGSCQLSYRFTPISSGLQSETITISSNDPNNGKTSLALHGTGANAPQSEPVTAMSLSNVGVGALVTVTGQGFGKQKGKVLIGNKSATVPQWADNRIVIKVPAIKAGTYPVSIMVKSKNLGHNLKLTVNLPQVNAATADKKNQASISGQYFGSLAKPKIYLVSGKIRKAATVLAGNDDNKLSIKMPKLKPAVYQVLVGNSAGDSDTKVSLQIQ